YYPYNPIRLYVENSNNASAGGSGATTLTLSTPNLDIRVGDVVTSNSATVQTQTVYVINTNSINTLITLSSPLSWLAGNTFTFRRSAMEDVVSEHLPQNPNTSLSDNPSYWPTNNNSAEWPGDSTFLEDKFVRFSYRYKFDDGEYSIIAPFTQPAFIPKQDGYFMTDLDLSYEKHGTTKAYISTIVDFMENKVNNVKLQVDTPAIVGNLYRDYKIIAIDLLYKESDETSIKLLESVPYTADSIAGSTGVVSAITLTNVGTATYISSGASNTTTDGNGTGMVLNLSTSNDPGNVTGAAIVNAGVGYEVGDKVFPSDSGDGSCYFTVTSIIGSTTFTYDYQSRKPITTLPADQTTRVYDKVPVRAFAQEIAGNRVIYGNYINKHTSPSTLNYGVNVSDRLESFEPNTSFSTVSYPCHSLKQNRNYQVGIVLADRFGRQSDVVLSSVDNAIIADGGGSTVKSNYRTEAENTAKNVLNWSGESLKVIFNSVIPSTISTPGYPGLYSATNPLGWYSYKIVVKQQQQEYYNVYLPGVLNGYPYTTKERTQTAFISLYSDNINKIPKDLTAVGPDQVQFNSDVDVWGRVINKWLTPATIADINYATTQYYPEVLSDRSLIVGTMQDLDVGTTQILNAVNTTDRTYTTTPLSEFYLTNYNDKIVPGMSVESATLKANITALGRTVDIYNGGSGYSTATGLATTSNGSGTGLTIDITASTVGLTTGVVTEVVVNATGTGYEVGDIIYIGGAGSGASFIIQPVMVEDYIGAKYSEPSTPNGISNASAELIITPAILATVPKNEVFSFNKIEKDIFYNENSNPYVARISTRKEIGTINTIMSPQLAVYETAPVFSNIPIYWETSSSGLISELNTLIESENINNPTGFRLSSDINAPVVYSQNENMAIGTDVTGDFKVINGTPAFITSNVVVTLASVVDLNNADRTSNFKLVAGSTAGSYKIQTDSFFAFLNNIGSRSFIFNLNVNVSGANKSSTNFTINGSLSNTAPTASATPVSPVNRNLTSPPLLTQHYITTVTAFNGSASTSTLRENDLTFTVRDSGGTITTDFFLVPTS
ncbi:MAG: hypothetical protein ACR2M9_00085, partial [Cyanophyceae cyanobacterium]